MNVWTSVCLEQSRFGPFPPGAVRWSQAAATPFGWGNESPFTSVPTAPSVSLPRVSPVTYPACAVVFLREK